MKQFDIPVAPIEIVQPAHHDAVIAIEKSLDLDERALASIKPVADHHGIEGKYALLALLWFYKTYGDDVTQWPVNPLF